MLAGSGHGGTQLVRRTPPTFKEEENLLQKNNIQNSTADLTTNADSRLGAFGLGAYPMRSRAAYPPPRWVLNYLLIDCGQKVLTYLVASRQKKLILVLWGQKILIFGAPETENIVF